MERRREVKKMYVINLCCDRCGKVMTGTDTVLATMPPKYTYECLDCKTAATSTKLYPYIKYEYGDREETIGEA